VGIDRTLISMLFSWGYGIDAPKVDVDSYTFDGIPRYHACLTVKRTDRLVVELKEPTSDATPADT
jgi:hypothetical protein